MILIFNEPNLQTLQRIDRIDLTVTSPPYNVDLGNNKYNKFSYDLYRDNKDHKVYMQEMRETFDAIFSKTVPGGRCVINIGDGKNGKVPTHSDYIQMMVGVGWLPYTVILWNKNSTSNRTAWGSYISPSSPSFPRPFEYILVFCKESYKLTKRPGQEADIQKEEFAQWSNGLWSFSGEKKSKSGHPAAFPIELPTRCIKMLSYTQSLVYDPFGGVGTTSLAAKQNNRDYVMSEISSEYCATAKKRLNF